MPPGACGGEVSRLLHFRRSLLIGSVGLEDAEQACRGASSNGPRTCGPQMAQQTRTRLECIPQIGRGTSATSTRCRDSQRKRACHLLQSPTRLPAVGMPTRFGLRTVLWKRTRPRDNSVIHAKSSAGVHSRINMSGQNFACLIVIAQAMSARLCWPSQPSLVPCWLQ